jgi:hypothetical protein
VKLSGRTVVVSAGLVAGLVVAVGWLTGAREVMYGALTALLVGAFLPFVTIAAVIAVLMLGLVVVILAGGDAPDVDSPLKGAEEELPRAVRRYYRWIGGQKHPFLWGTILGTAGGVLALWGLIAWLVVPREAETTRRLLELKETIDAHHAREGDYPGALPEGAADAFGRPFQLKLGRRSRFVASYTVTSVGFDGRPGRDDLCISGRTRLAAAAEKLRSPLILLDSFLARWKEGELRVPDRLRAIAALRCDGE